MPHRKAKATGGNGGKRRQRVWDKRFKQSGVDETPPIKKGNSRKVTP